MQEFVLGGRGVGDLFRTRIQDKYSNNCFRGAAGDLCNNIGLVLAYRHHIT